MSGRASCFCRLSLSSASSPSGDQNSSEKLLCRQRGSFPLSLFQPLLLLLLLRPHRRCTRGSARQHSARQRGRDARACTPAKVPSLSQPDTNRSQMDIFPQYTHVPKPTNPGLKSNSDSAAQREISPPSLSLPSSLAHHLPARYGFNDVRIFSPDDSSWLSSSLSCLHAVEQEKEEGEAVPPTVKGIYIVVLKYRFGSCWHCLLFLVHSDQTELYRKCTSLNQNSSVFPWQGPERRQREKSLPRSWFGRGPRRERGRDRKGALASLRFLPDPQRGGRTERRRPTGLNGGPSSSGQSSSNAAGEHCTGRREVTGTYRKWGGAYVWPFGMLASSNGFLHGIK